MKQTESRAVEYWIWLQRALGPGSARVQPLLARFNGAGRVYEADRQALFHVAGLTPGEIARLCDKSLSKAQEIVGRCLALGVAIVTPDDPDYPQALLSMYAPPCALYWKGEPFRQDALHIAMVGTRQITDYGYSAATQIAMGLAHYGAVVVSGLAIGVDAAAHKGALKGGGKTIAVIGCGVDIDYPAANRELHRLIVKNGAVVSEYPPGQRPASFHFPIRNRIIAGLSQGTVVVEAGRKSGSLITASLAAEMGKDVFAVPGSIFSPLSEGAHQLLRDGAKPVSGVLDILEEYEGYLQGAAVQEPHFETEKAGVPETAPASPLADTVEYAARKRAASAQTGPESPPRPEPPKQEKEARPPRTGQAAKAPAENRPAGKKAAPPHAPAGLSDTQTRVLRELGGAPVHVDEIALRLNLETRTVLAALTTLEIRGLARSYPGRRFACV